MSSIVAALRRTSIRAALAAGLGATVLATGLPAGTAASVVALPAAALLAPGLRADLAAADIAAAAEPSSSRATVATAGRNLSGGTGGTSGAHRRLRPAAPNHVWSADLGLNRPVAFFPCSRSQPPAMAVYRWGCAGDNNIYLFAHAGGPFRRLHDLYDRGRLHRGMTVSYAGRNGVVHRYRVVWWRVVLPTAGAFAYAAQARPSMTLQTCVGAHDRYRLVVRLRLDD